MKIATDIDTTNLVGKVFKYNGRGPEIYDCWGLVMEIYRRSGIELPDYNSPSAWKDIADLMSRELIRWQQIEEKPGAVIGLRTNERMHHVGICLPFGKFIHASESKGMVAIESIRFWERNIVGYYGFVG